MSESSVFLKPRGEAGEVSGAGWRLSDQSEVSKQLLYEDLVNSGAVEQKLGVSFGAAATTDAGLLVCGVRPGEWLLLGDQPKPAPGTASAVTVDLTHGLAMFRLTGLAAPNVLAAVCSIDTAEAMLPNGAVCGTSVARVASSLIRHDVVGERSYLIISRRSSGRYLFDALRDAGAR